MRTVAVVGASLAGLSAARSLRKQGYDGRLVVIGDEPHRPYDRPPLSKEFLAGTLGEADLALEPDGEDLRAEWLLGVRAAGLDRAERAVRLADGSEVRADGVVIATGAAARTLPGTRRPGRGAHPAHPGRRPRPARRTGPGRTAGGDRRRLHRRRGRLHRVRPRARRDGRRGGPDPAGRTARRDHGQHRLRPPRGPRRTAVVRGGRQGAERRAAGRGRPAGGRPQRPRRHRRRGGRRPPVRRVARRAPASRSTTASSAAPTAAPAWPVWSRSATAPPGTTRAPGVHRRVEHWTGARERPDAAVAALLAGGAVEPGAPRPPYFWSDQYGVQDPVRRARRRRRQCDGRGRRPGRPQRPGRLPACRAIRSPCSG